MTDTDAPFVRDVPVDMEDLKALFDIAVNSMDFGSGFLDTDEVNVLRRIAVTIGVDPITATPSDFAAQYPHQFDPYVSARCGASDSCKYCSKPVDHQAHGAAEAKA